MKESIDKSMLFFILSLVALWLVMSEFFGNKYITQFVNALGIDTSKYDVSGLTGGTASDGQQQKMYNNAGEKEKKVLDDAAKKKGYAGYLDMISKGAHLTD